MIFVFVSDAGFPLLSSASSLLSAAFASNLTPGSDWRPDLVLVVCVKLWKASPQHSRGETNQVAVGFLLICPPPSSRTRTL